MDASNQADRIAFALILFAVALVVVALAVYLGIMLRRVREANAAKIRTADRAFWAEQIGRIERVMREESAARLAAESDRLYRRDTRLSE